MEEECITAFPEDNSKRVAIARALASEAKVLLADEPTGNLDEDTAREIIELIKKTAHELGKCVIVVTHSKQLAEEADVVLAINQGVLHEQECLKEKPFGKVLIFHSINVIFEKRDRNGRCIIRSWQSIFRIE